MLGLSGHALFTAAPAPMLVVAVDAPHFTIVDVNDAYLTATLTTRDDLVGRGLFEAMPDNPEDTGATGVTNLRASIERAIATGRPDRMPVQKYDIPHPGGGFEERCWEPVNTPAFGEGGEVAAVIHHVIDATDRVRSDEALRRLNETLESQVAARTAERDRSWQLAQELLVVAAPDGTLEAVNPIWTELLGWSAAELIGSLFIAYTHPDDAEATLAAFADIFERPLVTPYEYRFRHKDGSYRWFAWTGTFENGRVYASGRHITVEREQAEALRQSQKMEAVGQLTGGLAHDFNNLLAGISGSLELMQARIQQGRLNDVERYMAAAQGAAKRAAALTHRLLAFSRRQTLDPKPTDVNRLVVGMQEMIQRTVGPGIPVEVVGMSGLWPALVDAPQLENALLNLCINARDAMPEGGRITVETANKWLDDRAARALDMPEGQYLSLCVTDTGSGMSAEVISRVFEPFFTTKPIGEGTGLGLSMIYGFAKQSGGQVRIYSEVGQGTTVCLYLPRHYGETVDEVEEAKILELSRSEQGEAVLIVDDEPTVRMLVADILNELGFTAIEVGDSAAGLRVLQSDVRIDLLITDVGLPGGMNGRQMADAARVTRPDLRVLFITGYAENAVVGNGHLAPGMEVLTKPFAIETMAARIRSMIEAVREARLRG
ncbi:PAS domain S-box-containing protein [Methylobacterium phyllostachyos]|uniref:histidine kinase n=2 Tax=Methylobacterium phyllostachyos TaxID=582672 RepID=A0A1G9VCI7_9HYPH|nr:PAS domain S-box-containing protein [Methylobacterium phyllostachyos]